MLAVGEIHAPLFPRILYVEYLPSVSSYCLLVCSCFDCLSFARAYKVYNALLCFTLIFCREVVLLHLLYLAFSR